MNNRDQKIRFKTIIGWILFSLTITEKRSSQDVKYPRVEYTYNYKVRYVSALIYFVITIPIALMVGGFPAIKDQWEFLFIRKHKDGDTTTDFNTKITKVFAYNRL